jgi:hypothetical protein
LKLSKGLLHAQRFVHWDNTPDSGVIV